VVSVARSRPLARSVESSHIITASLMSAHQLRNRPGHILPPPRDIHAALIAALTGSDPLAAEEAGRAHVREAMDRLKAWNLSQAVKPKNAGTD
jgi:DNA-binding GntR family transcriptional regulator